VKRILIVDDEVRMLKLMEEALQGSGRKILTADSGAAAWALFEKRGADLVITDLRMESEEAGLELLAKIHRKSPETPSILITAFASIDAGVRALELGAVEYLTKPVRMTSLGEKVRAILTAGRGDDASEPVEGDTPFTFDEIIVGRHPGMRRIYEMLPRVVASDSTVLILGESGTGKEVFARAMHEHGKRKKGPFVQVNCAALVDSLLEAELFGVEKGAATDVSERPGKFELAQGGTLLLDEIGDMAPSTQAKVLRVLQERELTRVGGSKTIPVDVRIVAATHRDLDAMIAANAFRQDLYYRINVIRLELPPLRERLGDLELYTDFFLKRLAARTGRRARGLTPAALKALRSYPWPGNVRELENVLERALVLSHADLLDLADMPPLGAGMRPSGSVRFRLPEEGISLEELERDLLAQAIDRSGGNKSAAARLLGLTRRTLGYRLEKYGLAGAEESGDSGDSEA